MPRCRFRHPEKSSHENKIFNVCRAEICINDLPNRLQPVCLLGQFAKVQQLLNDRLQTVLLLRRLNEPQELKEADSLILLLQFVFSSKRIAENPGARIESLYLSRDLFELLLDRPKISLQLFEHSHRQCELLSSPLRSKRRDTTVLLNVFNLLGNASLFFTQVIESSLRIIGRCSGNQFFQRLSGEDHSRRYSSGLSRNASEPASCKRS